MKQAVKMHELNVVGLMSEAVKSQKEQNEEA